MATVYTLFSFPLVATTFYVLKKGGIVVKHNIITGSTTSFIVLFQNQNNPEKRPSGVVQYSYRLMGKINIPGKSHFRRLFLNSIFLFTFSVILLFPDVLRISFSGIPHYKKRRNRKVEIYSSAGVHTFINSTVLCVCKLISNSVIFSNVSNFHLKKDPTGHFLVCLNDELDRNIRAYLSSSSYMGAALMLLLS